MKVIVNPGHSMTDPGAIGKGGTYEADVTLHVAHALLSMRGNGVNYIGKRQGPEKKGFGRLILALRKDVFPVMLSLHCNAHTSASCIHRADIYWWEEARDAVVRVGSRLLAEYIADRCQFAEAAAVKTAPYARATSSGPVQFTPAILRYTAEYAAVLIELGFATDVHVEAAMLTREWVLRAASSIDAAVRDWKRAHIP